MSVWSPPPLSVSRPKSPPVTTTTVCPRSLAQLLDPMESSLMKNGDVFISRGLVEAHHLFMGTTVDPGEVGNVVQSAVEPTVSEWLGVDPVNQKKQSAAARLSGALRVALKERVPVWLKEGNRKYQIVPIALEPNPNDIQKIQYSIEGEKKEALFSDLVARNIEVVQVQALDERHQRILSRLSDAREKKLAIRYSTQGGVQEQLALVAAVAPDDQGRLVAAFREVESISLQSGVRYQVKNIYLDKLSEVKGVIESSPRLENP